MTLKLVSENAEAVEPTPTWQVIQEAGQGMFSQEIVQGYPSHSGPLMTFFSAEDDTGTPVFMCSYHRIVTIKPYVPENDINIEDAQLAN